MNADTHLEPNSSDPAARPKSGEIDAVTARHLKLMRQEAIFTDGALPACWKALAAALWGVSARCEPCARFYVQKAQKLGATRAEIAEMLAIASVMGGCVGETWAAKAGAAVREDSPESDCCET